MLSLLVTKCLAGKMSISWRSATISPVSGSSSLMRSTSSSQKSMRTASSS